jgi:hypothetical protein
MTNNYLTVIACGKPSNVESIFFDDTNDVSITRAVVMAQTVENILKASGRKSRTAIWRAVAHKELHGAPIIGKSMCEKQSGT